MATFRTGRKTHPTVLPQRSALEFESADTPGIRNETGFEDRLEVVSGAEHVRGETIGGSPCADGVTPDPVGEPGREAHTRNLAPYVFVLDTRGTPLQPCAPTRARKLLAKGRAAVHRHTPFTIRLKDRDAAESEVDGVEIGIDPGSKHSGIAVFTVQAGERRGRCSVQLDHRGAKIRKKIAQRSARRRRRRSENLRYRAPRFLNRSRTKGWLPPSLRHRVETTVAWVDRLTRWAPVRAVHVERAAFDTHVLSTGHSLEGAEYQQGTLHGYEVREYLLAKFRRSCAYCGITEVPINIDHVHPRSRGGSDRLSNLVLACVPCDQAKNDRDVEDFVADPEVLDRILSQMKTPLRDAAAVRSTRGALWCELEERSPTRVGTGGRTNWNRTRNRLPKSHTPDALCVGEVDTVARVVDRVLIAGCAGRGSYVRTRADRYGFPRLSPPRIKRFFGFATGDLVRAVVPSGKKAGIHVGRVAVRASGNFNIATVHGTVQGVRHKYVHLLQRADGYGYTWKEEGVSS